MLCNSMQRNLSTSFGGKIENKEHPEKEKEIHSPAKEEVSFP